MTDHSSGCCNLCSWRSVVLPINTAKQIAVYHVLAVHPEEYTRVTGKPARRLVGMEEFELMAWTDRAVEQEGKVERQW